MFIKYIFHKIQKCAPEFCLIKKSKFESKVNTLCCKDIRIRKLKFVLSVQFLFYSFFLGSPLNSKLYNTKLKKSYYQQAFIVESEIGAGYFGTVYRFAPTLLFSLCFSHCSFALEIILCSSTNF